MVGAADAVLAAAAAVRPFGRRRPPADPPRRILLLRLERIGDLLMARPAITAVRRLAPDARIDLEVREINRGHAVLTGERSGEVGFLDETELDQVVANASAVVSLLLESLIELILSDQPFSQQQIADPRRFSGRCCQGRGSLR